VHSAEVIVSEVQSKRRVMVGPSFAECVCQSRESSILHSHAQVVTFDYGRANAIHIRLAHDDFFSTASAFSRGVARVVHYW